MRSFFSYFRLVFPLSLGFFVACATLPTLDVTYKTKPKSHILEGGEIYFAFFDKRVDKDIIGKGAKKLYKNFAGNINFIVLRGKKDKSPVKIYDVEAVFKNTFSMYLKNMGLKLLPEPKPGIPEVVIKLNDFVLDLSGRKWIVRIAYEAEFIQDGKVLVRKYKGEGEKYRISGLTQAHQAMSDIFTDIVNQLDVKRLFVNTKE